MTLFGVFSLIYLVLVYCYVFFRLPLSIFFYLLAYRISSRTILKAYGISISIFFLILNIYYSIETPLRLAKDEAFHPVWSIASGYIYIFCMASIIGIISKYITFYFANHERVLNIQLLHNTSFIAIFYGFPQLLRLIDFVVSLIINIS